MSLEVQRLRPGISMDRRIGLIPGRIGRRLLVVTEYDRFTLCDYTAETGEPQSRAAAT